MATSMVSWGFGLSSPAFSKGSRAKCAATTTGPLASPAYLGEEALGVGPVFFRQRLVMATPGSILPRYSKISGVIHSGQTILHWQSAAYSGHPDYRLRCRGLPFHSVEFRRRTLIVGSRKAWTLKKLEERKTPAEWLNTRPRLALVVGVFGISLHGPSPGGEGPFAALDFNTYNFYF